MSTGKEGPLTRLARKLGLDKTRSGRPTGRCWACDLNHCGADAMDLRCPCCRSGHSR